MFFFFLTQQALTKVPTNVQHFADLGVYKHLKKKTHLTKDVLFPHLPGHPEGADPRKVNMIKQGVLKQPGNSLKAEF